MLYRFVHMKLPISKTHVRTYSEIHTSAWGLGSRRAGPGHDFSGRDVDIIHFPFLHYFFVISGQVGIQRYWQKGAMVAIVLPV